MIANDVGDAVWDHPYLESQIAIFFLDVCRLFDIVVF